MFFNLKVFFKIIIKQALNIKWKLSNNFVTSVKYMQII